MHIKTRPIDRNPNCATVSFPETREYTTSSRHFPPAPIALPSVNGNVVERRPRPVVVSVAPEDKSWPITESENLSETEAANFVEEINRSQQRTILYYFRNKELNYKFSHSPSAYYFVLFAHKVFIFAYKIPFGGSECCELFYLFPTVNSINTSLLEF